ncbi:hypothetical protein Acsp05_29200 [Actinokineospora sp. NBRC 105648]|nr:hypothetical protein Acsp05_29200 [Actinokineospora sp. NBRC 105648]
MPVLSCGPTTILVGLTVSENPAGTVLYEVVCAGFDHGGVVVLEPAGVEPAGVAVVGVGVVGVVVPGAVTAGAAGAVQAHSSVAVASTAPPLSGWAMGVSAVQSVVAT